MKTSRGWYIAKDAERSWDEFKKKKKRSLKKTDSMKCGVMVAIVQYKGNAPWRTVHGVRYAVADIGAVGDKFAELWIRDYPQKVMRIARGSGKVYVLEGEEK